MAEAQRIAAELLKMHEEGFIEGPDDPNARIYAKALRLFRVSFSLAENKNASQRLTRVLKLRPECLIKNF